jgi:hypothetical protein
MATAALPARAGIGLKLAHARVLLADRPDVGFLEVHAENLMGAGGPPHAWMRALRERLPLSLHGVALSLGADAPLDRDHLARLRSLCLRYEPAAFSEHLAWSSHGPVYLNDLLPVAYDEPTLGLVADHVDQVQATLGRRLLLENPSTYLRFQGSSLDETEFLDELARRTGCGLLLDLTNVWVSATNHCFDPLAYLARFPLERVAEIHLAGAAPDRDQDGSALLIDAHDRPVADPVWDLYARVIARTGPLPTLIEWDDDVPDPARLVAEAHRAEAVARAVPAGPAALAA